MAENRTFIPAFRAHVGDWDYYSCLMTYGEVARQVGFAYELGGNIDLTTMLQRGLSRRTHDIKIYLLESDHRFLGSLVVAAWGGTPIFKDLKIEDPPDIGSVDANFGALVFDGSQQYFALDGQHRLRAIKDAIRKDPGLAREEISVLIVTHFDTPEGQERTRRLFTNINRNARPTAGAENIALDEDDGFAIIARDLITTHPFLSREGVVRVFTKPPTEGGELKLATNVVPKTDPHAWTTITALYDMLRSIGFGLDPSMGKPSARPPDDVLTDAAKILGKRIERLLTACDDLGTKLFSTANARELRAPKGTEGSGHPLMRPVIQKAVLSVIGNAVRSERLTWDKGLDGLSKLSWRIDEAPWTAVFNAATARMITGKDNTNLLTKLLVAHLCPDSKEQVHRARKEYSALIGKSYSVPAADMYGNIRRGEKPTATVEASSGPGGRD